MRHTRTTIVVVGLLVVAAIVAASLQQSSDETIQAAGTGAESANVAGPTSKVTSAAMAGPPAGYYECYFYDMYGLQGSSMTSMRVLGGGRYEALDDAGDFTYDSASNTLTLTDGGLGGLVAHVQKSDGKPAIVFLRKENEKDGKPAIDISDTWCYLKPR